MFHTARDIFCHHTSLFQKKLPAENIDNETTSDIYKVRLKKAFVKQIKKDDIGAILRKIRPLFVNSLYSSISKFWLCFNMSALWWVEFYFFHLL